MCIRDSPRTEISRQDVIEDSVYAQLETDGETPASRTETVLSAIFFVVSLIARAQGWEQDVIERYEMCIRDRYCTDRRRAEGRRKGLPLRDHGAKGIR